jgi:membrane-associated protein
MPFGRFTYYNIIGGVAWIFALLLGGYLLGQIPVIKNNFELVIIFIAVVTFVPAIWAAIRSRFQPKKIEEIIEGENPKG